MTSTSAAAAAVLTALLSSLAAYLLGAVVLPFLASYVRRDRALRRLGLPTPKPLGFAERLFGTMSRFDPSRPANYCRTVMTDQWARECGDPPLMASRGLYRHLVIVLEPAAATSVLSRASGQEKSTSAYFGLNLISDPRGRNTVLSHETASPEWKAVRKAVAPAFSQAAMKASFERAIRSSAEAAAEALGRVSEMSSASADGTVSVNVDELAAATAMDVITAFGFGVRSNAVERLGAKLAEEERAKKTEKSGGGGGGGKGNTSSPPPIPVPAPSIPGAEDTVDAMHAATEAAELYVFFSFRVCVVLAFEEDSPVFFSLAAHLSLSLSSS